MSQQEKGFCLAGLRENPELLKTGISAEFAPGCMFQINKYGTKEFNRRLSALYKLHQAKIDSGTEEGDEIAKQNFLDVMSEVVFVGWSGVVDPKGKDVPYSVALAKEYLAIPEVFKFVEETSKMAAKWRMDATLTLASDLKN
jgi:hypothetical protein